MNEEPDLDKLERSLYRGKMRPNLSPEEERTLKDFLKKKIKRQEEEEKKPD